MLQTEKCRPCRFTPAKGAVKNRLLN